MDELDEAMIFDALKLLQAGQVLLHDRCEGQAESIRVLREDLAQAIDRVRVLESVCKHQSG